jgi:hypothetical protein
MSFTVVYDKHANAPPRKSLRKFPFILAYDAWYVIVLASEAG